MKIVSQKNIEILSKDNLIVGYLLAGYPSADEFVRISADCAEAGLDIYELGFPGFDPYADGEIIRTAHGLVDKDYCQSIEYWQRLRAAVSKPLWLMAYHKDFIASRAYLEFAKHKLMDAIVIPDMGMEERLELAQELAPYGVDVLGFVNPSMTEEEMRRSYESFPLIYAQLHAGQTGSEPAGDMYHPMLKLSKGYPGVSAFAGFGINTGERVSKLLSEGFKGAVVGTSMMKKLNVSADELIEFIKELEQAAGRD